MNNQTNDDEGDNNSTEEDTSAFLPDSDTDRALADQSTTRIEESEGKLGDNDVSGTHQASAPVSVVDSLLLQHQRSQQLSQDLSLADMYRMRRDQDQLHYIQQQLEQERRLHAFLQQQQVMQQSASNIPLQDMFSGYDSARNDLLLQRILLQQRQEQQATSFGDLRRQDIFTGQAQLSPEAELYATALRESAAIRQHQQHSLLSGFSLPWADSSNPFHPVGRRPTGTDVLPVSSGGDSLMGDMSSASLRGYGNYGGATVAGLDTSHSSGATSDSPRSTRGELQGTKPSSSRKRAKGGGWPKDRPKRPLSAYNIFFKEERARILAEIPESTGPAADAPDGAPTPAPAKSRRRRNRNTHGKISFESLAKTIGRRWQEQTPEQVRYYKEKAGVDMLRYKEELQKYNDPIGAETTPAPAPPPEKEEDEDQKPPAEPSDEAEGGT